MGYPAKGKQTQVLATYEARPEGQGPFPTIILFMHAYGIDDSMKKVCDDLAKEGFYTLGHDAYLNGSYEFQTRSNNLIFTSFHVMLNWMKTNPLVDQDRMGAIGFCMGGNHVYQANAFVDIFKSVVSYYGFPQLGEDADHTPMNLIDQFTAPVLSIFGSEDKGIPPEAIKEYQEKSERDAVQ